MNNTSNLEVINDDFKLLLEHGKSKTFAYSRLYDELDGLGVKLSRLQDDLDYQLKSITSMQDDEYRAKEQLGIELIIRDSVKAHIVETGTNHKYGARPLRRAVQNQLEDKLAEAVLSGEIKRDSEVVAGISKKEIKFTVKTTKEK